MMDLGGIKRGIKEGVVTWVTCRDEVLTCSDFVLTCRDTAQSVTWVTCREWFSIGRLGDLLRIV